MLLAHIPRTCCLQDLCCGDALKPGRRSALALLWFSGASPHLTCSAVKGETLEASGFVGILLTWVSGSRRLLQPGCHSQVSLRNATCPWPSERSPAQGSGRLRSSAGLARCLLDYGTLLKATSFAQCIYRNAGSFAPCSQTQTKALLSWGRAPFLLHCSLTEPPS